MKPIQRTELLRIANLVRPALATQDYIPALTHIKFDGEFATAYNDISAIAVQAAFDLKRCVPGDLLIRALGAFGGETVALAFDDKTSALLVSSGRSKIKLPTLPAADLHFELPDDTEPEVEITKDMLQGIERCLLSVSDDPKQPAQMGVTLEVGDGDKAVFYSTDNITISRYATDSHIELPGDVPVILPTFFCQQLLALAKAFPREKILMVIMPSGLLADFMGTAGSVASLFTKTLIDLEPIDFDKIVKKFVDVKKLQSDLTVIPDSFDAAFDRALLVLGQEIVKTTKIHTEGVNVVLHSTSQLGDSDDVIDVKRDQAEISFLVNPALVSRAFKTCAKFAFYTKTMVLSGDDGKFVHLVSHVTS